MKLFLEVDLADKNQVRKTIHWLAVQSGLDLEQPALTQDELNNGSTEKPISEALPVDEPVPAPQFTWLDIADHAKKLGKDHPLVSKAREAMGLERLAEVKDQHERWTELATHLGMGQ